MNKDRTLTVSRFVSVFITKSLLFVFKDLYLLTVTGMNVLHFSLALFRLFAYVVGYRVTAIRFGYSRLTFMIRKDFIMFTINEKKTQNGNKELNAKAVEIASQYKELSREVQYLLTAYLTLLCDIKQVRVDNDPQTSLARQVQYVAENRLKGDYDKVASILASFADYFDVKAFEKAQSKPTPKADFIAFLNTHKNVQLATALAKGKEFGLSDSQTLEAITLWTAGQAVNA